jgi:hypothetical protein
MDRLLDSYASVLHGPTLDANVAAASLDYFPGLTINRVEEILVYKDLIICYEPAKIGSERKNLRSRWVVDPLGPELTETR